MFTDMEEWVLNDLYEQLIQMPLWVQSAFGSLRTGDVLAKDDVRITLITHLVCKTMDKCPAQLYDTDYRHSWRIDPYIDCVKSAVEKTHGFRNFQNPY